MPKMGVTTGTDVEVYQAPGAVGFHFSAARPDTLSSVEYTLATIVVDVTGSVTGFDADLLKMLQVSVDGCRKSPRAENLLVRVIEFNTAIGVQEIHGFLPLDKIDTAAYQPFRPAGGTNLYDAAYDAVTSETTYGDMLTNKDLLVNGAVYVITDGENNMSTYTAQSVKDAIAKAVTGEHLESLHSVLIGINDSQCGAALKAFQQDAGFSQYVPAGSATPSTLAKLAGFISNSVSSQSQSLGTGGPSKNLTF